MGNHACTRGCSGIHEFLGAGFRRRRGDPRTPLASSVRSITVRAVTRDHAEGMQYCALPTDDPVRALNILREAAGLQPLCDGHDDQGGSSVSR
jgi:hypothetical protein